jgi:5'-deoxynucleotidase YfbR-like HD superfamily hydrolase
MNSLFPPELRTASVVQRWSIVRTLNPDSVANHSFYVCFYALQIARLIEWAGPYADLTFAALMHDVEEVVISDIISPVKKQIVDEAALSNFVFTQMKERLPLLEAQIAAIYESQWGSNIERIIKVADKVDATIHLILEQRQGNAVLEPLYRDALENLVIAWHDLGQELIGVTTETAEWKKHQALWNDQIYPALQSHWRYGSVGIT